MADPDPIPGADLKGAPWGGPTGVRFIDYDGALFYGKYSLKEEKLVLTLFGTAPVKGLVNTNGTKYLTITLERPKPRPPQQSGVQLFARPDQ